MAEIEHFVHPDRKQHPRFATIQDVTANFWSGENQIAGKEAIKTTFKDAVGSKMVDNETLGYFLARTYLFLTMIGVNPEKLRFRQHDKVRRKSLVNIIGRKIDEIFDIITLLVDS